MRVNDVGDRVKVEYQRRGRSQIGGGKIRRKRYKNKSTKSKEFFVFVVIIYDKNDCITGTFEISNILREGWKFLTRPFSPRLLINTNRSYRTISVPTYARTYTIGFFFFFRVPNETESVLYERA